MLEWRPQPVVALWLSRHGFDLCLLRDEMNYSVVVLKAIYDCLTLLRQSLKARIEQLEAYEKEAEAVIEAWLSQAGEAGPEQ
jgi:hypothetical protein